MLGIEFTIDEDSVVGELRITVFASRHKDDFDRMAIKEKITVMIVRSLAKEVINHEYGAKPAMMLLDYEIENLENIEAIKNPRYILGQLKNLRRLLTF